MKVVMIGAGYVGLVSGACFAEFGASVTCVDVVQEKIDALRDGVMPIYEPGLDLLVKKNVDAGRLGFSTDLASEVPKADIIFIAVGTPTRRGDGHADLKYVYAAAKQIGQHLNGYTVIVNKSTVPVGTASQVSRLIAEVNPEADFSVASNPEFLREGAAIGDFMRPDRVVLGIEDTRAEEVLRELYRPINLIEAPILVTNWESAELTKYAANAFLATKISFINEIANLCEAVGADVHDVAKGMGLDARIGKKFLHPGPGYGGSCFPKDTLALIRIAQENDVPSRIVESVVEVNAAQKARMVKKIRTALGDVSGKTIAILGLTFKPETDDMRDSPSLSIIPPLLDKGAIIKAHDPKGFKEAKHELPDTVQYLDDVNDAIADADAIVIMTEWNEYRSLNLAELKNKMRGNAFIDLRNVYERHAVEAAGFDYAAVGR
ncbi:UDP-glucose/GDP-mannose dehydrogenase family protein [Pseudomonadales bacterium]|nr:UDP-glucose/GDP-mannose dehydrogenase family protein [Pseudomonadales bacterium]